MAGNVAFMFLCTIMVLGMTPGLGMFYGGMVRRKNALNTMMFCFAMMGIGMLLWVSIGYSLCFGEDHGGIIGDLHYAFLQNVPWTSDSDEVPPMMLALFNMMFAVISPAIILGSLAERMKFSKMMLLCIIWTLVVYYPLAHMTWGGGFLDDPIGSIDFAGGNVIHISTGVSGLVACMILGKRKGFGAMSYHPHNIPLFLIGAAVLWVGWLGFNCGCAGGGLDADGNHPAKEMYGYGCGNWWYCWLGRHYAGSRLCPNLVSVFDWCDCSPDLFLCHQ